MFSGPMNFRQGGYESAAGRFDYMRRCREAVCGDIILNTEHVTHYEAKKLPSQAYTILKIREERVHD